MSSCKFQKSAMHTCGSYQFNLGKYQGDLCDVHYWQTEAEQLRQLCRSLYDQYHWLPCPNGDCDNNGCITQANVRTGEAEQEQCKWCYERGLILEKYTKVIAS